MLEYDGCGETYAGAEELRRQWPDIPDIGMRIAPGERVPYGECNECGALVHQTAMIRFTIAKPEDDEHDCKSKD